MRSTRINVILPEGTVAVLDRLSARGGRGALIDRAIRYYVESRAKNNLREQLRQEARSTAEQYLQMAAEWFPLEEEAWALAQSLRKAK